MLSTGEFFAAKIWKNTTADLVAGFVSCLIDFIKPDKKKVVIVLDNASVHTGKIMKDAVAFYKNKNVDFHFLPPYSPELNRIERLWHKMKYTWMTAKRRTKKELEEAIDDMCDGFGEKYIFSF